LSTYAQRSPWLRLVPAVSGQRSYPFESGDLPDVVARHGPWTGYRAVVAGPREMVSAMLQVLPELGVPAEHIVHDPE
jgi:NAD(P)H-flavin reductase